MSAESPQARTRIRLCGPLTIEVDGRDLSHAVPGGQAGAVLLRLLADRERAASREELIEVVWPERRPDNAHAPLRPILSRVRRAVTPAVLEGRERLRLALPEPVWIDVEVAADGLEAARAAAKAGHWNEVRDQAAAARDLVRPGLLPGHDAAWLDARRREVEELEFEALEWLARSGLELGGTDVVMAERAGRELTDRAPFRESGWRLRMDGLAAAGNIAQALQVYEQLRTLLRDELGTVPAPEIQALHGRLLAGDEGRSPEPERPLRVPLPSVLAPRDGSAFVGRAAELELLRAAWRDAAGGARRLVLVAGEPGIGKTRLTREFAREAHDEGTVLYAGCQEEALVSYQPFVEALRQYASTAGLDGAQLRLGPGAGELARLIPELGSNGSSATTDPETRRYFLFDAVTALLTEISARAPLALVLDDLHWADRATLALLRHVVTAPSSGSLLIVGTYRDAEVGAEHPLAGLLADLRRERLFDRVLLPGLDADGVSELIASHAGHEAPGTLVEAVHERTEGNPFFVEEVMRHLIEVGTIFERGGRWESTGSAEAIGVPEGVKEVLARRLGRLSEQCATALAEAAVLGREFTFEVLAAMSAVGEDDLIAALEEAVAAQLVVERPGPSYAFTHALVRETLYGELSGPRRQRMHARAGAALEATHGETHIAQLALHYRLGGTAGDLEKAIDYSMRAGGRAFEDSAWDEAAVHWDGAVAVMRLAGGREGDRARLLVALADLMVVVGDLGRQLGYLEQALELYERAGDEERAAQVHSRLGMANSLMDSIYADHLDIGRAFQHFDAARAVLSRGAARKAGGHLEVGVSTALTYGLRVEAGMEAATRAMEVAESIGDELLWAGGAQAYAWHALASGRLSEGFASTERAWEVADRHQRPFLAFMGTNIRGQWTWGLGAPDEAEPWFERPLGRPYAGNAAYRQQIADGVGRCNVSRGELDAARRHLADAKPTWVTHSLRPLLDLWDGRWDAVEALAERTLATSRRTGNRWDEWAAQHLSGRVRWLRGEHDAAAGLMETALAIVVEGRAPYFELWVRTDLARVLAASGRAGEARVHVERCRAIVGTGEDWRGRAGQAALAEAVLLAAEDRPDEADAAFSRAHATLERHRLVMDAADALEEWGRALEMPEKLDAAAEIYASRGAGAVWLERVRSPAPSSAATRRRRSPA